MSWEEYKQKRLKDEEERQKRQAREQELQARENRISTYNNIKNNAIKQTGEAIKQQNLIKQQQQQAMEEAIKQQASQVNTNLAITNPTTVTLPTSNAYYDNNNNRVVLPNNLNNLNLQNTSSNPLNLIKYGKGDIFKATNGAIDDRTQAQKSIDNALAPIQNFAIGVESTIPSIQNYTNALGKKVLDLGITGLSYKYAGKDNAEIIGDVLSKNIYDTVNSKQLKELEEEKKWRNNAIEYNLNKTTNPLANKVTELAPSLGQNILPMAFAAAPIPGARAISTGLFMTSAAGNYLDDAKERGMNDDQALGYATVMGIAEGGSEALISGGMVSKVKKALTGKTLSEAFLNSLGTEVVENFAQEAVMEPLQEGTAQLIGGEDKANWDNIVERSLKSGMDGVLSALMLKGASIGLVSSQNVMNKIENNQKITETDVSNMINDLKKYDRTGYEQTVQGAVDAIKTKIQTQGKNVVPNQTENAQQQLQQQITFPIDKMAQNQTSEQIQPTDKNIVENLKNQAEKHIKEADISEYDKKMMLDALNNMQEFTASDYRDVTNTLSEMQVAQVDTSNMSFEDVVDNAMNMRSYEIPSPLQERNIKTIGKETKVNAYQYDNPEVKPYYKEMAQILAEDITNISDKANRTVVKNKGTQLMKMTPEVNELHNKLGYSYNDILKGLNNIIEDHGAENNALSKKIEIVIDSMLRNGYVTSLNQYIKSNDNYINLINKEVPVETKQEPTLLKDKDGNVLKVYHGSPNSNISQFDSNLAGRNTQSDFSGIFFTDNPNVAEDFSYEQLPGNSNLSYKRGKKGSVYEKNLSYKNALNLNDINESNIGQLEKYLDEKKMLGSKEETLNMMKQMANYNNAQGVKFYLDLDKVKNDYDLIIADMGGTYKGSNEYIVFDNSQIKNIENKVENNLKQQQLDIIKNTNPMTDDYHTGIRDINDIKTFEEAMQDDESFVYGDFTLEDAEKALKNGKVTVYSSQPIEPGSFVSTSQNMAKDYAGNGQIYSQEVNLDDVAWINGDEGQYAKINNTSNQTNTLESRTQENDLFNADDSITEIKLPTQDNKQVLPTTEQNNLIEQSNKLSDNEVAKILTETQGKPKTKRSMMAFLKANLIDKGMVFEELSRKANNRDLQGKWDYTLTSEARGQYAIGNERLDSKGNVISKSLTDIIDEVGEDTADFYKYMYNQLNIDRMTLEDRFGGDTGINYERTKPIKNKPVFGESVTADISRNIVAELEQQHPEFKEYAKDVYDYLDANTQELVNRGVISKDTQALFKEMYPHYVPISRVDTKGNAVSVPLDTGRTGINNPIKRATGGSSDIQPMFNTIADRTLQTYRASARNSFGIELKNTLSSLNQLNEAVAQADIDEIIDSMSTEEQNEELLKKGEKGQNPTFTVFDNGNKTTYEITEDMYDALKPKNDLYKRLNDSKLSKGLTKFNNFRRGLLTEYNPVFSLTNAIKDAQDVLINSQHAARTYAKLPESYAQILKKGTWYKEYVQNGGEQNSYFRDGEFEQKKATLPSKVKEVVKLPLNAISNINNVIEMSPRLAEYIASREQGRSIETSMLDAARVTTNFKAGGDFTKTLNRNGATFLNASVQGFQQQVRNIQEANAKGLKGYAVLATKYAIAGLPALLLNNLVWRDDEDYEQLQDYVKDNYYIIGKTPDGTFIRIPKGRAVATIQKIVSNVNDFIKDDKINSDDVGKAFWDDLKEDVSFAVDNLAPNNPLDNNIIAPITQAATNKTWYGSDLVPSRLKDKPAAEQYDETTDAISKWIGKTLNVSPVKVNYLLDQYSGGVGDVVLPMLTPQAENNAIEDKFTTNSTMKSKYPGEFFEKADELKINNNSEKATDEDKLKYKYISNVQSDVSDLYKQKREIQNSDISDTEKKQQLQEVQKEINKLTKEALENVKDVKISNDTAKIGNNEYYKYKDSWTKVSDKEKEKLNNVSLETYADYKNSIEGLTSTKDKITTLMNQNINDKEKGEIYENFIGQNDNLYDTMKLAGIDINEYLKYKTQEFTSDKEDDGTTTGKSVSGSKKAKVVDYVQNMNIPYNQKLLLLATQYSLTTAEKSKVANYVNSLKTTKANKLKIYESLSGFTVYKDGKVTWK